MNARRINLDQHGIPTNSKGYADIVAKFEQIKSQEQRGAERKRQLFAKFKRTEPHRYGRMEMFKALEGKIKIHPPILSKAINNLDS
jgi:hypothetical protein